MNDQRTSNDFCAEPVPRGNTPATVRADLRAWALRQSDPAKFIAGTVADNLTELMRPRTDMTEAEYEAHRERVFDATKKNIAKLKAALAGDVLKP